MGKRLKQKLRSFQKPRLTGNSQTMMPYSISARTPNRTFLATFALLAAVLPLILTGCGGTKQATVSPDEEFGHRYDGTAPDGRTTFVISPPEEGVDYLYYPAVYDTVHVRPAPMGDGETQIEVLVKGSFPDSCTELHDVSQKRFEHVVNLELQMRKPRGTVCASVMRPYRFYVTLDGRYDAGNYTLKLNDRAHNFVIRAATARL